MAQLKDRVIERILKNNVLIFSMLLKIFVFDKVFWYKSGVGSHPPPILVDNIQLFLNLCFVTDRCRDCAASTYRRED